MTPPRKWSHGPVPFACQLSEHVKRESRFRPARRGLGASSELARAYEASFSSRTTIDFDVGVLLTSAVESSGTSTFVSG